MKAKALIFMLIFMFIFTVQIAPTKKLESVLPIPGLVMIVDIKLIDNFPIIEKINSMPGRYNKKRENLGGTNSLNQGRKSKLSLLDVSGKMIYETEFDFPRLITIPPLPPEYFDPYTPAVIPIEEPEVTLVLPYFQEAALLEVWSSSGILTFAMPIDQMTSPFSLLPPEPPPSEMGKFHVLIMASNYDSSNMDKFTSVANSIKQFMLDIEPFSTFSSKVEVHIYSNTQDLGCYSGCLGIDRLICCDSSNVISAASTSGYLYDEIIVVHNTPDYGGGGYRESGDSYKNNSYNTYAVVYGGTDFSINQEEVALHEFGHSFGNLCDEYSYGNEGYIYNECVNCRANCIDWISITAVCQAGCDAKSEYFRPEDSIMIYLSLPYFNQASIKATYFPDGLEKRLKYFAQTAKSDFLGTWTGQGVYYRNSDTEGWVKMATPASKITAGDIDGDGTDDLLGIWPGQGGVWVKYSSSSWALLSSTADWICAGNMNGDGRDDLLGTWTGQGVYYRNSANGQWVMMATPATQITAGDLDDDGTDDLIGIWSAQGGVWVKYSSSGSWSKLSSTADWIACGDMNGDGRDDLLGTWTGQGVYYKDSTTTTWVKMATPATQIVAGDLDGDGTDDLIGLWPGQGGVWVKYSSDETWESLSSTADWIACGKMRSADASSIELALNAPIGGFAQGPSWLEKHEDLSADGPGGWKFAYQKEENLVPLERGFDMMRTPGPGEPGFRCIEQNNLEPWKGLKIERVRKKRK